MGRADGGKAVFGQPSPDEIRPGKKEGKHEFRKQFWKQKKKIVASAIAVALAAALMIGGTFSYLKSKSDLVTNSFTPNTDYVSLTETGDGSYNIIPGTSEKKDPTVTYASTVETYVYVVIEDATDGLVTWSIASGWTLLSSSTDEDTGATTYVYYQKVDATGYDEDGTTLVSKNLAVLAGNQVSYSAALDNDDMLESSTTTDDDGNTTTTYSLKSGLTLTFQAYMIQTASFDDAEEAYPYAIGTSVAVSTADALTEALADDDVTYIVVTSDIALTCKDGTSSSLKSYLTVDSDKTLDLSGYTLSFDTSGLTEDQLNGDLTGWPALINVTGGATLTIEGGTFDCTVGNNGTYGIVVDESSNLIINDGTFYGAPDAVYVMSGTATIYGGTFDFTDGCKSSTYFSSYYVNYLLNCLDSAYESNTASITVYGGSYVSFNPGSNGAEGTGTNFVASGYSVSTNTNSDGETVYTVSASSSSSDE